ncbi:MAG: BNR-4 repeat-containing protein [Opitutales bacterium]|nr:BNR-4 repeat-containing protein [Opitutales bacterium]MCH8541341.1 BNR repeat-containing protein [Opitutales bacterium]
MSESFICFWRLNFSLRLTLAGFVLFLAGSLLDADEGLFVHTGLLPSFGDGSVTNAGYAMQDRQPLASFEDPDGTLWQVVAYISLDRLPVIQWRKRETGEPDWSLWARTGPDPQVLPATGSNWHGYLSVGIDTAGYAHFIYDGRGGSGFRYYRSAEPVQEGWSGDLVNRSGDGIPGWSSTTNSTYWRFSKHPETGMMTLALRRSGSGHALFVLNADTQEWTAFPGTRSSDGRLFDNDGLFAHYVAHDVVWRGDDLYVGYSERQSGNAQSNEDLSVVKFDATSGYWQRLDGTVLSTPIGSEEGTIIDPAKTGSMLDHRWDMMADGEGRIHGFYRRRDGADYLQIFHFWLDGEDEIHGPYPVTDTTYTGFWQDGLNNGASLSQARSFYLGERIYVAWQEEERGNQTVASASRYPFTEWTEPQVIDATNLLSSDPEFERWGWDTREEIWMTTLPFLPSTPAGRPVEVVRILFGDLPVPEGAGTTFVDWVWDYFPDSPSDRDALVSPAGDGLPNLLKYALGMNPKQPGQGNFGTLAEGGLPLFVLDEAGRPVLQYRINTSLSDIAYIVERSTDLESWMPSDGEEITLETNGPIELREVRQSTDNPFAEKLFLRLRIEQD